MAVLAVLALAHLMITLQLQQLTQAGLQLRDKALLAADILI
jgi:hypothetical protein